MKYFCVLLMAAGNLVAQSALGPADGRELPPADLNRVAVGQPAPHFALEAAEGRRVTLAGYRGQRVVLVFYRGQW